MTNPTEFEVVERVMGRMHPFVQSIMRIGKDSPAALTTYWITAIEWGIRLQREHPEAAAKLLSSIEESAKLAGEEPTLAGMEDDLADVINGD